VIVHIGAQDTRTAITLAEHAAANGADALASIPPINRSHAEVLGYYRELARAASGLPLLVYHIPTYTHHTPTADQLAELLDIRGVIGLKFTDYNLLLMNEIHARQPNALVLYGRDEQLLAGLMFGAAGGVGTTYNIAPRWYVNLWEACRAGRYAEALEWQKRLNTIMHELLKVGVMTGTEAFLKHRHGIHGCFRPPSQPLPTAIGRALAKRIARLLA
jgi:N-acetylneuraminate lyase